MKESDYESKTESFRGREGCCIIPRGKDGMLSFRAFSDGHETSKRGFFDLSFVCSPGGRV
jgi:hypothetical protein